MSIGPKTGNVNGRSLIPWRCSRAGSEAADTWFGYHLDETGCGGEHATMAFRSHAYAHRNASNRTTEAFGLAKVQYERHDGQHRVCTSHQAVSDTCQVRVKAPKLYRASGPATLLYYH